ncbi:NAD-dependent epimerase/dehydratase family protein [Rhizomonospora bruguierae]|uniref:NAD-dependent epimerase/dehydratase family protein n=1 Tax=Rhizomonospora bruguierae TaxID=1581705 RepID=UPI0024BD9C65|nr:NAD-dependent epimerase/dehydratase family protein [Micromonospora sp. NBRC 107566]
MRVLVTGASGYVGWAVVHELRERGHDVVAMVHESSREFPLDVELRTAHLLSEASLSDAVMGVEGVCHLAAMVRVREAAEHPTRVWRLNVAGTLNLLDALAVATEKTGQAARLVLTSTGAVYGTPAQQPISEDAPLAPINPYAASKVAAEQVIAAQAATGLVGATSLRIFNAAGAVARQADPDTSRIIPKAVAVAAGQAPAVVVNGDGTAVRDFVHVGDIAAAVVLALEAVKPGQYNAYNVGAVPASVNDVIASTERITGRRVAIEHRPAYAAESPELRADTAKIRGELGWSPLTTRLDELVADQWDAGRGV